MVWIICIVSYFLLVWLFLRFFQFVSEIDRELEKIQKTTNEIHKKINENPITNIDTDAEIAKLKQRVEEFNKNKEKS